MTAASQAFSPAVIVAAELLRTIFPFGSFVSIRPVEAWTEGTKKKSRVDYEGCCTLVIDDYLETRLQRVIERAAQQGTNVFFGVAPRFGHAKYEEA